MSPRGLLPWLTASIVAPALTGEAVNPEDTLLDLSEECPTDEAETLAILFPWVASSVAELMIARRRMPPDSWFTVYVEEQILPFCEE